MDVAIVGGGAASSHLLAALARLPNVRPMRIALIERGADLGAGLAYGEAADPRHTFGRVATRRRDRGKTLRAQLAGAVDVLVRRGFTIELQRDTVARGLRRDAGAWHVDTDRGVVAAEHVVLATGHWHVNRLRELERAVDWRWDVRRLRAGIRDDEDVVVLGTSQSAIDIAIALGGGVPRRGKLVLASRRGLLPSVWGPIRASRAGVHLERLRVRTDVCLADIVEAIRRDGAELDLDLRADGAETLRRDLAAAVEARRLDREIPWQAALWPTVPAVFDLFPRLVAEDRLALAPHWYPCLRHLEAIHVANAHRILDLVDAGRLHLVALGPDVTLTEDAHGVTASGARGIARGHRIVDARGPEPRIAAAGDPFLDAVLASGHAVPGRAPYRTRPRAGLPYLETGGLWVDPATFRVRDDVGRTTSNLHALGPLTMGQFPVYLGLWALRRAAARIADTLSLAARTG